MQKRLLEVASNELAAAQEPMLLLGRKTARERLASFLLTQSRRGIPCAHSRKRFKLCMMRIDTADYLGLTIETISRTFTRLNAEGLIDIASQSDMVIRDAAGLEAIAGGMPYSDECTHTQLISSNPMPASVCSKITRRYGERVSQIAC